LFFTDNFSVAYVVSHSNRDLSTFYKVAALWSGQEGSLLFWSCLLSVYVFSVLIAYRNKNGELMPYVGVVMAGVQIFFLMLNNFVAGPFRALAAPGADGMMNYVARADGNGLTPLLQYPEMVIHPPNLYSGYTGFTIPFAFALGALLARYPGEKWIHLTRKWTMIAWMFQSMGILLGAHWAYAVLGWGGYWGWDPVENASLLPWLTGTAFLHSVMMQEKRGMMKVWNVWLVYCTFLLHPGHVPDAQRSGQLRPRIRAIQHRNLVRELHRRHHFGLSRRVFEEPRLLEERESARLRDLPRIELPFQQFDFLGFVHCGPLRDSLSCVFRVVYRRPHQRGRAVLQ
jgi:c-type cytochrome biogenesis protein CcmF